VNNNNSAVLTVFFSQFYNFETKKLNIVNVLHLVVRSINFFLMAFVIIWASYFAIKAEINFGIVSSAICIGTPLNCILSYIFWKEKMNPKMIIGTTLIVGGVVFLALAKGSPQSSSSLLTQEEKDWYRVFSIALALCSGCLGSARIL
jgi:drug/metabolite transporter (DMT)-like permease